MTIRAALRLLLISCLTLLPATAAIYAQSAAASPSAGADAQLEYVVALSRHGVRSPITQGNAIDQYSAAPWPQWEVKPGYMTPHGYQLMKLFGIWDRSRFSSQGLFAATGCDDASHVSIYADSDQRTRETGKALAEGMFPGCSIAVHAQAEGTLDPLFSTIDQTHPDYTLAAAAVSGRIGNDPAQLTEAFRPQLTVFDNILAGCGQVANPNPKRVSVFDIPAGTSSVSTRLEPLRGPVASTLVLAENLLLEYTDGMPMANVGWGCMDEAKLREVMQLSEAAWNYRDRTPAVARMYAANLLSHIERSMEQKISGEPLAGALGKPDDRMLLLVGHDTNIATVAGALGIDWVEDSRVDDTPPGGALLFELWRPRAGGQPFVRVEYTAQTLDQMRESQPLTPANPPAQAPVFVPACSRTDMTCTWDGFSSAMRSATDPAYVAAP